MREDASPGVEGVVDGVLIEVGEAGRVDVGETEQPAGEVGGVVVGAEDAAEVCVEHGLRLLSVGAGRGMCLLHG